MNPQHTALLIHQPPPEDTRSFIMLNESVNAIHMKYNTGIQHIMCYLVSYFIFCARLSFTIFVRPELSLKNTQMCTCDTGQDNKWILLDLADTIDTC